MTNKSCTMNRLKSFVSIAILAGLASAAAPVQAQPVRPNILLVFDTSTSMLKNNKDGSTLCMSEGQDSRLFRLKQAIRETLIEVGTDEVNFGLARFAQRTTPATNRGCFQGHYINAIDMGASAGCKTSAALEDADGAFFAPDIAREVVTVPVTRAFPPAAGTDFDPPGANVTTIFKWLDNKEESDGVTMTDPEIRSGGSKTPLAATLTYTRHYFQKYVKPLDPVGACRKNIVLLVTDGAETCAGNAPAAATSLFANMVDVFVVAESSSTPAEKTGLDAIAKAGSGNKRTAIFVDFTNAAETKKALINIIAEAVPPNEVCNAKDDNCNGDIDNRAGKDGPLPGVGNACVCPGVVTEAQAGKGICKRGMSICSDKGMIECVGCVGPQPEICNGIDDDCNGLVDDNVKDEGSTCACGSTALMTLMTGECKPGKQICRAGKFECEGCQLPGKETCDCKDNDCNAQTDEGDICGGGFRCLKCKCELLCTGGEFPCPVGFVCDATVEPKICRNSRCSKKVCPVGFSCDPGDGQCKDLCAEVKCNAPQFCKGGACVDCYSQGCKTGEFCLAGTCQKNPCEGKKCGEGRFCNTSGKCEANCNPQCQPSEQCIAGKCELDPCAVVSCPLGLVCDPQKKACVTDECPVKSCGGRKCVPTTGECIDDPCKVMTCPNCYSCDITNNGKPYCKVQPACYPSYVMVESRGGGLECGLGRGTRALSVSASAVLLVGFALLLRRRRR